MRVALITPHIGHYQKARYESANEQFEKLYVVSVRAYADVPHRLTKAGLKYEKIDLYSSELEYKTALNEKRVHNDISSIFDQLNPDVIVISGWASPESFAAILWAKVHGAGIVLMSESQDIDAKRRLFSEWIKSKIVTLCDSALVGGRSHASYIEKMGIGPGRIFFGYDVVDNKYFSDKTDVARTDESFLREKYGLPKRYILASGRFIYKKNFPCLIKAYDRAVRQAKNPAALVILGDGPEKNKIKKEITKVSDPSLIILPGFRSYEELPIYYGFAEAFIHVAIYEQWGLVINEACASGLPLIISSKTGASSELALPETNSVIISELSIKNIETAILSFMDKNQDSLKRMGNESAKVVQYWTTERFAQGLRRAVDVSFAQPGRRCSPLDLIFLRTLSGINIRRVT